MKVVKRLAGATQARAIHGDVQAAAAP